jgi:hypothetical protein
MAKTTVDALRRGHDIMNGINGLEFGMSGMSQ